jgi:hypothetical protein
VFGEAEVSVWVARDLLSQLDDQSLYMALAIHLVPCYCDWTDVGNLIWTIMISRNLQRILG